MHVNLHQVTTTRVETFPEPKRPFVSVTMSETDDTFAGGVHFLLNSVADLDRLIAAATEGRDRLIELLNDSSVGAR